MWSWLKGLYCKLAGHSWKSEPPYRVCKVCGDKEQVGPKPEDPIVVPPEYAGKPIVFPMDSEREEDNVVPLPGFNLKCLSNDERTGGPRGEKDVWVTRMAVKMGAVKWLLGGDGSLLMTMSHFTTPGGKKLRLEGLIPVSDSQGRTIRKTCMTVLSKADQSGTCRVYWTRVE